jgi:DNA-binding SARP family transcriptional activator
VGDELRIRLLGGFDAIGIEPSAFGSRKVRTLVARLALAGGAAVDVAALGEALWPDQRPTRPADQLAVLASRARGVLGRERLTYGDVGYSLQVDWLDVRVLDELADEAERRLAADQPASARAAATAGIALYRGPLLPEHPDASWAQLPREAVERQIGRAYRLLATAALIAGAPSAAMEASGAALEKDPYDEPALRLLLRACASLGAPASGLMAYERTRQLLSGELGVDPDPETQRLHLDLLRGEVQPAAPAAAAPSDLPGRDRQIAMLDAALATLPSGGPATIVDVCGEAGIGKSRLLMTFAARLGTRAVVGVGRCGEHRGSLPLQPIIDAIRSALATLDADARRALLAEQPATAALLADSPGVDGQDLGEGQVQPIVFRALADVVHGIAGDLPAVLMIDDIALADPTTLAWISYTAERTTWPLLIVVSRRVEHGAPFPGSTTIELGPLDESAVAEVVGPARARQLHARTGGHPLFLALLAESAVDADADQLPTRLVDSIADRVGETGAAAATLHAAAVVGQQVDVELLARVLDRPIGELLDHLEAGVRCRLLVEGDSGFDFAHALVRDALVATTSPSRRAWLHRQTAAYLAEQRDVDPAVLAHHARLAGDARLTSRGLVLAADVATRRFAHESALELLDEAATLSPGPEVERRRVRVLLRLSRHAEATQAAALAVAEEPNAASYECLAQAAYYDSRDYDRTAELARAAAERSDDPAQVLRCLALAGRALHAQGRLREADDALDEAEARSAAAILPDARLYRGALRFHQGRSPEALALLSTDTAASDTLAFASVMGAMMRGLAHAELGDPRAALADFDRFEALAADRQLTRYGGRVENCRGYVLRNLGRVNEARHWHEQAAEIATGIGQLEPEAHALLDLADICLDSGQVDEAASLLDRADQCARHPHVFRWRHMLRSSLLHARLAMLLGDLERAEDLASNVVVRAEADGVARYVVLGRLMRAAAQHASGQDVERADVNDDLLALDELAGMDGWRLTQDMAKRFDVAQWRTMAEQRVDVLRQRAGDLGEDLAGYAAARS